jgi:nucleotide-binding universal stress UspA family protein
MNTRGLVELIALNIGLDLGVISPALFTIMVLMALVTTFMTTPLLARIYPPAMIRELAAAPVSSSDVTAVAAPRYTALVCVSSDVSGPGLVTVGSAVAGVGSDDESRIYALRLVAPTTRASDLLEQRDSVTNEGGPPAEEDGVLKPTLDRARELAITVRPLSFMSSAPAKDICDVAEVKHADLVLLGWHHRVFGSTMLSGTVHQVMRAAAPTVGVFVDRGLARIQRILVPYLGSEHDQAALAVARRVAQNTGARVTILHVVDSKKGDALRLGVEEKMREEFREVDGAKHYDVELRVVSTSDRGKTVIEESARGYDLLLIGMGKQWGLEHRSFGVHAERILERSAISVLVIRRALDAKAARAAVPGEARGAAESDPAWSAVEPTDA